MAAPQRGSPGKPNIPQSTDAPGRGGDPGRGQAAGRQAQALLRGLGGHGEVLSRGLSVKPGVTAVTRGARKGGMTDCG